MRTAIAYLRRSSANTSNGAGRVSYAVQEASVLDLAARNGDAEPELIVEWGRSGAAKAGAFGGTARGGKRRAFALLRERVIAGEVSVIYAYSLSRLARSTRELLDLAETCAVADTRIQVAKEGTLDFTSSHGRLYLTILSAVATFEAEVNRDRAMDRVTHARESGRYLGAAPLGWQITDGVLVRATDRFAVDAVLTAFQAAGNYRAAARALNGDPIAPRPPRAALWSATVVRTIVSRELATRAAPSRRGSRTHRSEPLARLLYCAACNGLLTPVPRAYVTRAGTPGYYRGWRCFAAYAQPDHPKPTSISETRIMPALMEEAARLEVPADRVLIAEANASDLAQLEERRSRLVDALEAGIITRTDVEPRLAGIEAERARLHEAAAALDIPGAVDWSWPPDALGPVLAGLWKRVTVNLATGSVAAEWTVPGWRAGEAMDIATATG